MKLTIKSQKAKRAGKRDYLNGVKKNPFLHLSDVSLASWWDAGYQEAERESKLVLQEG